VTSRLTTFALHLSPGTSVADGVALARRAETLGVDAVYGIEGVNDVFVPLAAIAAGTTTIRIGSYVANAYARTPQAAAFAALSLDDLSAGRFSLGLGAGNRHVNEWVFGQDSSKPMRKMQDYLAVVRALLSGETPDGAEVGGTIHHMQARFVRPPARRVPIVLAAAGPRMIELAATASDGVGLGILISPEHLADDIRPRAETAAAAAGRDPADLRFPMAALVNVDDDAERARQLTRRAICGLFHPVPHPYYDFLLRQQGYAAVADAATELAPQKRWNEAMASIDDELIDHLTITGTPEQCAARLNAYRGIADEVICLQLNTGADASTDGLLRMLSLACNPDAPVPASRSVEDGRHVSGPVR
jgi:alkanesulfonate monooxygenase SsuD/methylene tetrahydromethanopterin reductase-like flavin-dependent oxidoreductase (luciferase family)